eukprot:451776-Amorphochlora_amoeboformis.AAC.1
MSASMSDNMSGSIGGSMGGNLENVLGVNMGSGYGHNAPRAQLSSMQQASLAVSSTASGTSQALSKPTETKSLKQLKPSNQSTKSNPSLPSQTLTTIDQPAANQTHSHPQQTSHANPVTSLTISSSTLNPAPNSNSNHPSNSQLQFSQFNQPLGTLPPLPQLPSMPLYLQQSHLGNVSSGSRTNNPVGNTGWTHSTIPTHQNPSNNSKNSTGRAPGGSEVRKNETEFGSNPSAAPLNHDQSAATKAADARI